MIWHALDLTNAANTTGHCQQQWQMLMPMMWHTTATSPPANATAPPPCHHQLALITTLQCMPTAMAGGNDRQWGGGWMAATELGSGGEFFSTRGCWQPAPTSTAVSHCLQGGLGGANVVLTMTMTMTTASNLNCDTDANAPPTPGGSFFSYPHPVK